MTRPKKILVATDFSIPARVAVDEAIDLARMFEGELHVVHVFALPTPLITAYEFGIPEQDLEQARTVARAKLDEAAESVSAAGVPAHTHLLQSPADIAITELAREIDADWIVVGTHGHTGLKHVFLGSVAERVVRHAPCSVLVARDASSEAS